jgi:hypothetical protein
MAAIPQRVMEVLQVAAISDICPLQFENNILT